MAGSRVNPSHRVMAGSRVTVRIRVQKDCFGFELGTGLGLELGLGLGLGLQLGY